MTVKTTTKSGAAPAAKKAGAARKRPARRVRYEMLWRNKYLTTDAKTLDDMVASLQSAADELRKMREAGVELCDDGGVEDDYAMLVTTDAEVAKRFGFEKAA